MIRIVVADDHDVVRMGLRNLLRSRPECDVCGEAATGDDAIAVTERLQPDVVVLDMVMPGTNGAAAVRAIRARAPRTEILVFTMHESEEVLAEALAAGARGCVLKTDPSRFLLTAIEALARHGSFLTPGISDALAPGRGRRHAHGDAPALLTGREREVVRLLAHGQPNRQVAGALGISVKTVESHRANVMRKLELHSIVDLVRYAVRNQLVQA